MKLIKSISESDFGREANTDMWPTYRIRKGARAILTNESFQIALMHVSSDSYYKLPGGGIDDGEDTATALSRELLEEVGASSIEIVAEVGRIDEYRDEWEMRSEHFCYIAKLNGPIIPPTRTEKETSEGYETLWAKDLDDAIRLVESGSPLAYGHDFERLRELTFLNEVKRQGMLSSNLTS